MASAISDKEDADTLEVIWRVIKRRCPGATVKTPMTDDGICIIYIHTYVLHKSCLVGTYCL